MPFNRPIPKSKDDPKQPSGFGGSLSVQAGKMFEVSVLLPCSAFVGWVFGALLDRLFHTSWIAMVGILFGGISGIVYVIRMVTATKPGNGSSSGDPNPKP